MKQSKKPLEHLFHFFLFMIAYSIAGFFLDDFLGKDLWIPYGLLQSLIPIVGAVLLYMYLKV